MHIYSFAYNYYYNTWYKYTIGAFNIYKEARDRRNEIWAEENKIDDAFVTAYNSGERITVQEALMISKQKAWMRSFAFPSTTHL